MKIVLDTSALISLAAGGVLELTVSSIDCIIPERVKNELLGLSRNRDNEGNLAREILSYREIQVISASKKALRGEIECAYLTNDQVDVEFLISDDVVALQELEKICKKNIRFSTIIVYAFFLKGKITKKQGLQIIERMRVQRNWKDNLIYEQAMVLWGSLD